MESHSSDKFLPKSDQLSTKSNQLSSKSHSELKLILYGHIIWIINFGVMRSLTIAFPLLKQNFNNSNSLIGLFTTCIMFGNTFGPILHVYLFKYIGIRYQTMLAGIVNIFGYLFIGATLKYKMVIFPVFSFAFRSIFIQ